MIQPIVLFDTPALRQKAPAVTQFGPDLAAFAADLIETLHATETGIGLAAQQVGKVLPVCVVDLRGLDPDFNYTVDGRRPPLDLLMPLVLVNPELDFPPGKPRSAEEGCLSFPEIRGPVSRQELVSVRYQDLEGGRHVLECDGLFGRCVQHEVDHLNGVLFIDRMSPAAREKIDAQVKALRKATRAAARGKSA